MFKILAKKTFIHSLILIGIFLLSLILHVRTTELERGHYTALYQSFIHDGDLNIINQVRDNDRWLVTKNYYHPTHLSNGAIVFNLPFYINAQTFFSEWSLKEVHLWTLDVYKILGLIRNAVFLWGGLLLLFFSFRRLFPALGRFEIVAGLIALSLSTPLVWYTFFEPFHVEITVFFLASLLFSVFSLRSIQELKNWQLFSLAIFLSLCFVAKALFVFFALFPLWGFVQERKLSRVALFGLGLLLPLFAQLVNNYVQTGEWILSHHRAIFEIVRSPHFFGVFQIFTCPNSLTVGTPIIFCLLLGGVFLLLSRGKRLFDKSFYIKRYFSIIVGVTFVVILGLAFYQIGFIPAYTDLIFSRLFLFTIPLLGFIFFSFTKFWRKIFWGIFLIAIVFHWLQDAQFFHEGIIVQYPQLKFLQDFIQFLVNDIQNHFFHIADLKKVLVFIPLIVVFSFILSLIQINQKRLLIFFYVSPILVFSYFVITTSNFILGPKHARDMKANDMFAKSVVSESRYLNYYDEVTSNYESGSKYLPEAYRELLKTRYHEYMIKASSFAKIDPLGFKEETLKGNFRPSLWNQY